MARILIVDDDPNCGEFLSLFLSDEGHDVRACLAGHEAVQVASTFAPELLLTDWCLNDGSDGLTLASVLRRQSPQLPVVFITGMPGAEFDAQLQSFPDALVLPKPLDLDRLLPVVNSLVASLKPGLPSTGCPSSDPGDPSISYSRC